MSVPTPAPAPVAAGSPRRAPVLAWLLLLPAAALWVVALVVPSLSTVAQSFMREGVLAQAGMTFTGLGNWRRVVTDATFWHAAGLSLAIAALRAAAVGIVPPALALGVVALTRRGGRELGVVARVAFAVPVVCVAAVPVAALGQLWLIGSHAGLSGGDAVTLLLVIDTGSSLAWACGLALFLHVTALDARDPVSLHRQLLGRPFVVLWGVLLLGAAATGLQSFTLPTLLTSGGPGNATLTLALLSLRSDTTWLGGGVGQAVATTMLLPVLGLGLGAGGLLVASPLRLVVGAVEGLPRRRHWWGAAALGLLFVLIAASWAAAGAPDFGAALRKMPPYATTLRSTVLPTLWPAVAVVAAAALAGYAIGFLRPLGAASRWLLLPVSPWLFFGAPPLLLTAYRASHRGGLGVLAALMPALPIAVPALFVLTLLFDGLRQAVDQGVRRGPWWRTAVLPALPVAGLLAAAGWMLGAQGYAWPSITEVTRSDAGYTVMLGALPLIIFEPGVLRAALALYAAPVSLLFFCLLGAYQAFFADRVSLEAVAPRRG